MKLFLTGGTGFIGSHVLAQLVGTSDEVVPLRRPGSNPCIDIGWSPVWLEKPMDEVETEDLEGADVLVHLASVGVSPKVATWDELFYWNVSVLVRLLQRANGAGVRRVVIAGSFSEYGLASESYDFIPADAPLTPTNPYAASKAASSIAARAFAVEKGMELFYLRIFSAFGDGQFERNFWPALRQAALSGADFPMTPGEQVRDYIAVEDVAAQVLRYATMAETGPVRQRAINVASGKPVTMREFAESWWAKWGAKGTLQVGALPYRPNEPMRYVPLVESE